jgi:hypothetical protein
MKNEYKYSLIFICPQIYVKMILKLLINLNSKSSPR